MDQYALRVLKAGGAGYLTKESAPDKLLAAVRKVSEAAGSITPNWPEHHGRDWPEDLPRCATKACLTAIRSAEADRIGKDTPGNRRAPVIERQNDQHVPQRACCIRWVCPYAELTHYSISNRFWFLRFGATKREKL